MIFLSHLQNQLQCLVDENVRPIHLYDIIEPFLGQLLFELLQEMVIKNPY